MKQRFCPYCQCFRKDEGFKIILHPTTGTKRGQCPGCQERRKRPRGELVELALRDQREKEQARKRKKKCKQQ